MSKFAFRLELMLKLCAARRDARRVELADTLARAQHVQRQIDTIDEELQALNDALPQGAGTVDVDRLLVSDRYGAALRENRAICDRQRTELADHVARGREALQAADRETRTFERLRERAFARYQAEAQRREQRELDEIAARAGLAEVDS